MKPQILIAIGLFMIIIGLTSQFLRDSKQKSKIIDLPEEIGVSSVGDTLKIERINQDTIFVVFANKRNN